MPCAVKCCLRPTPRSEGYSAVYAITAMQASLSARSRSCSCSNARWYAAMAFTTPAVIRASAIAECASPFPGQCCLTGRAGQRNGAIAIGGPKNTLLPAPSRNILSVLPASRPDRHVRRPSVSENAGIKGALKIISGQSPMAYRSCSATSGEDGAPLSAGSSIPCTAAACASMATVGFRRVSNITWPAASVRPISSASAALPSPVVWYPERAAPDSASRVPAVPSGHWCC